MCGFLIYETTQTSVFVGLCSEVTWPNLLGTLHYMLLLKYMQEITLEVRTV